MTSDEQTTPARKIPRLRFVGDGGQELVYFAGGMRPGRIFVVPAAGLVLGRGPDNVPSARVSRRHIRLEPHPEGLLLTELRATNATAVNGVTLAGGAACVARIGDRITLDGTIELEVIASVEDAGDDPRAR